MNQFNRRRKLVFFFFATFLFSFISIFAQQKKTDSLLALLKKDKQDTSKINHFIDLGWNYYDLSNGDSSDYYFKQAFKTAETSLSNTSDTALQKIFAKDEISALDGLGKLNAALNRLDESLKNYQKALAVALSIHDTKHISFFYGYVGYTYYKLLNYPEAIRNFKICISIAESEKNKDIGALEKYYNIFGNIYSDQGNYSEAANCYFSSLKLAERAGSKRDQAYVYANLCTVFMNEKNYTEALKNISTALKIHQELKDTDQIVTDYIKIGDVAYNQGKLDEAMENYVLAKKYIIPGGANQNRTSIALSEGNVYYSKGEYDEALKYYEEYKKEQEEYGDSVHLSAAYGSLANVYVKQKNYVGAEKYILSAIAITKKIGYKIYTRDLYLEYAVLDSAKGDFRGAFENHKLFMIYNDSLNNDELKRKTLSAQMNFDFEKKEAVATAEHKKELEKQALIASSESRKQSIIIWSVAGGLLLVLVFAGFILKSLRVTNKQKRLIEQQKEMVEEKQKEILDSIHYARRIQHSLLPNEKYIDKELSRLKGN